MAAETGNTYISETVKDSIEIPAANLGFKTIEICKKVAVTDCNSGRQPVATIYGRKKKRKHFYLSNCGR